MRIVRVITKEFQVQLIAQETLREQAKILNATSIKLKIRKAKILEKIMTIKRKINLYKKQKISLRKVKIARTHIDQNPLRTVISLDSPNSH